MQSGQQAMEIWVLAGEYAVSHGLNGKCGCDECVQRMLEMAKDGIDDDEDKEDEDEDSSGTVWYPYSSLQAIQRSL